MNYLREINAFYDWLETNSISDSAIVLWHALMHTCNKAGWITEFAVAISTLETKTGLKKNAIQRARQRLQQVGRIDFRSRSGQQSAIYTIIPFENNCGVLSTTNRVANRPLSEPLTEPQTAPIIKLNETKLINKEVEEARAQVVATLETEFGRMPSPSELEKLEYYISNGMDKQVVCEAIKRSRLNGVLKVSYVEGILKSWLADGVKDLAGLQRLVIDSNSRKGGQTRGKSRESNLPDYSQTAGLDDLIVR